MGTVNRTIQSEHERTMAARLVENRPVPFTLTLTDGKHRSTAQNRLQHMWMKEISEQRGDITPEEARAYCKLTIGIPILRAQNEAFRLRYDEILKPLSYAQKLSIMSEPLNLPVTSLMSTKQFTEYLDGIIRHFGEQGIILTIPDDIREQISTSTKSGETSSQASPEPADDNSPVVSPAEEGAGDCLPSAPSLNTAADPEWLKTAARMLWSATNVGVDTDANLSVLNAQRLAVADECPPGCDQAVKDKAGSIYRQCKAVVMSEVSKAVALKYIAGVAGIEERELQA